jgi:DNA-binding beta-propeller fold protein YncE
VWVTREPQPDEVEGYLVQIDPAANEIVGSPLRIGVGPGPVTFGAGAAWVTLTAETGALVKVDPGTMTKVGEVDGIRGSAWFVAGEMWAATGESIARIDPSTTTVVGEIPMPFAREVDFGSNAAWVLNDSPATAGAVYIPDPRAPGSVVEIDPLTGKRIRSPVLVGNSPSFLAAGEGAVWVAQYDSGLVTRIDPQP